MLKLIARLEAKPGREEFLEDAMRELAVPSRGEEGCLMYDLCRPKGEPGTVIVLEEWTSQAALDEHMASPHFKGFLETAGDALAGAPGVEFIERL